jgi:hypothetical protein
MPVGILHIASVAIYGGGSNERSARFRRSGMRKDAGGYTDGMTQAWRKRIAIGAAAACALCVVTVMLAPQNALRALASTILRASGYTLTYDRLDIRFDQLAGTNIRITTNTGEPIVHIATLRVAYSIPDVLFGRRTFGLKSMTIDTPQFTLIRHRDGSWNVPIPKQSNTGGAGAFNFFGSVREGSVDIYDQAQGVVAARHLEIRDIEAQATICSQCRTGYSVSLAYVEEGHPYRVSGSGEIDPAASLSLQHWHADALPIAHIVNVALNSPSFHLANGTLQNLDARVVENRLVDVTTQLEDGRIAIGGLRKPLRDVSGPIDVYADGLLLPGLRGTIAGVPVVVRGGVYDLADPQLHLAITSAGDLHDLRTVIAQTSSVPITGPLALNVLVEGPPSKPLMMIALQSPHVQFGQAALSSVRGRIAFDGREADVLDAHAAYDNEFVGLVGLAVRGKVALHPGPGALAMVGNASAPNVPVHGIVLATSDSLTAIDAQGALFDRSSARSIRGIFRVNGEGVGTIGPLSASAGSGSLYAIATLDRPHQTFRANVVSSHFPLTVAHRTMLIDGAGSTTFNRGVLTVGGAAATGVAYGDVSGTIARALSGAPHYALAGHLDVAEIGALLAWVNPAAAALVEGRVHVNARVAGSGTPQVTGTIESQEGAVNGLAFHSLNVNFGATPTSVSLHEGRVAVGTTNVAFAAALSARAQAISVDAPRIDLQDFNDFFDTGDMLGGTGSVAATASRAPGSLASSGRAVLRNARVRDLSFGALGARWYTNGDTIESNLAFAGDAGALQASGGVTTSGDLRHLRLHATNVDIGRWLAMAGYDMPVSARVFADAQLNGPAFAPYGTFSMRTNHASVAGIPIDALSGGGRFGLGAEAPLDLMFDAHTDKIALAGTSANVRTQLQVRGTRTHPLVVDRVVASNVTYHGLTIPQITALVHTDMRTVTLQQGEADLQHGKILATGTMPLTMRSFVAQVNANDVELTDVASLLPHGTTLRGRIDGDVAISGTLRKPSAKGQFTLANGFFESPQESVPVSAARATLAFAGSTATLRNTHATLGSGTIDAQAQASIPDVMQPASATITARVQAQNASIDAPAYVKGTFEGNLAFVQRPGVTPTLSGTVATDSARIPMTALYSPSTATYGTSSLPNLSVNLHVHAGRDVRVQSSTVDLGASGDLAVNGTLSAPSLSGVFHSTGGTVSFGRTFDIESGSVRFDPSGGIMPYVHAVATTYIAEPSTDITLSVKGPADHMNLTFDSSPEYDRAQILSLLALGGNTNGSITPSSEALALAGGQINDLFTRNLLEPFSAAAGSALGLQNLQISNTLQSGLGVNAMKALGKTAHIVFADSFGEPRRQSLGLQVDPSRGTRVDVTAYSADAPTLFTNVPVVLNPNAIGNNTTIPDQSGEQGIALRLFRTFP